MDTPESFSGVLPAPLRLDLGSGPHPKPGFKGVDRVRRMTDYCIDFSLGEPWPFDDNSVDELWSSHLIEHLPADDRRKWVIDDTPVHPLDFLRMMRGGHLWRLTSQPKDLLLHFFDEAFRIIKPGGKFEVRWPSHQNSSSYGDPTHRRTLSGRLISYLNRELREKNAVSFYDVDCNWQGEVFEIAKSSLAPSLSELEQRSLSNWNETDETVMRLVAVKEAPKP